TRISDPMASTDHKEETGQDPRQDSWLDWAPIGLWGAGLLAVLRVAILAATNQCALGTNADTARLAWDLAGEFPAVLTQALVVGLACAALLSSARANTGQALPLVPFGFTATLFWSVLSGWPLAPESQRSVLAGQPALDDAMVQGVVAVLLAAAYGFSMAASGRAGARALLRGIPALIVAATIAAILPAAYAWRTANQAPTYERRVPVHDFLEHLGKGRVLESVTDHGPALTVITPIVAWETDSGDKPSLRMTPPCSMEFTIDGASDDPELYLRAAAGIDKRFYNQVSRAGVTVEVEFAIEVNGDNRFAETVVCEPREPGKWDPTKQVWHHAGGTVGLAVEPGDTITLRTRLTGPTEGLDPADMNLGFGGLVLERAVQSARARASAQSPNIVLIVMDTLRADRMSCYGYERSTTPHLDLLASRGILFENAYATSSWTWPSTASILTGLPADAHGVTSNESCTLVRSLQSLPEALQDSGYTTAAFACNPLISAERYFDQGFEHFDGAREDFWSTEEVAPRILKWIDDNRSLRFFLYLHLADPHTPHRPDEKEAQRLGLQEPGGLPAGGMDEFAARLRQHAGEDPEWGRDDPDSVISPAHQRWISEVYDASVATGDRYVGQILKRLEALGLADRTIVAFTADHGEELLDRGRLGHGHTLYPELVHVPLILTGPGMPAGVRRKTVVSNRHLAPTLATLAGTSMRDTDDALFLPRPTTDPGSAFVQTVKGIWDGAQRQELFGLREDDWYLQVRFPEEGAPGLRLFQLRDDPLQTFDLAATQPERAREMLEELSQRLEQQREAAPATSVGAGAGGVNVLRAIGYTGSDDDEPESKDE
ncbi:MAG: arylsulfatase, partial [Gammaproteobacteria bacterium]